MDLKVYQQIHALTDPIVTNYRNDLLKHDQEWIQRAPQDLPFLHYTRAAGTHIVALHQPHHLDEIFQNSTHTEYLFGSVTRHEFIQKKLEEHDAVLTAFGQYIQVILYYDPRTEQVFNVSAKQALAIITQYTSNTQ